MLYDRLIESARRGDRLDEVRLRAVERSRWLADLVGSQHDLRWRAVDPGTPLPERNGLRARESAARREMWTRLTALAGADRRAAAICLLLAQERLGSSWGLYDELKLLIPGADGWTVVEMTALIVLAVDGVEDYWGREDLALALTAAERLDLDDRRAIAPLLQRAHGRVLRVEQIGAQQRSALARRIRQIIAGVDETRIPAGVIPDHDSWAAPLRELVAGSPGAETAELARLLAGLSKPRPAQRWRRRCHDLASATAAADHLARCLRALAEGDPLCSRRDGDYDPWATGHHHHYLVHPQHGDLARGVVWAAALTSGAAAVPGLVKLALRAGSPGGDVIDDLKICGAAVNALGEIDDPAALAALWRLQGAIRNRGLRKQLDAAIETAAGRQGITPGQLVERSVPAHGLGPGGALARTVGDHRATITVEDAKTVRLAFADPGGRALRSAPAALKESYADEIKELRALAKEIRDTLAGERSRIEGLLAADRVWPYDEWARHYRDHPITGVLARALIWEFEGPDGGWTAAVPDATGPSGGRVRLWHPIRASVAEIRAWRETLTERLLRQPFKQAFREIYLLTPAEERTGVYSNRFAAHIVHYSRLYALFKERGWRANFLGAYEGGYEGEARSEFAEGAWRACFYHEPADDDIQWGANYAATDQVRFERRDGGAWVEAPLSEVPPLVFSEAMRDVDLFVGVTSIAADPDWIDRGEDRHLEYWRSTTFAELSTGAQVRRDALARIITRTKIADRCAIDGRFLIVRGELRTYKIHLGSANILMEPDGAYLCVVPSRRAGTGSVFLPFEDERLALILSKAFLLAADQKITDETILDQIRPRR